jgi:hypothetical protein
LNRAAARRTGRRGSSPALGQASAEPSFGVLPGRCATRTPAAPWRSCWPELPA